MEAARFNVYWFLALLAPAAIMIAATYTRRILPLLIGVGVSLFVTYNLCYMAVDKKWDTRMKIAQTDAEREYASADGANRVATVLVIAPFEAVLYTSVWGIVGWRRRRRLARH
jgi:hypothetical protein